MSRRTKLELTWPGKDERPKLEPRILIEDAAMSHHANVRQEVAEDAFAGACDDSDLISLRLP